MLTRWLVTLLVLAGASSIVAASDYSEGLPLSAPLVEGLAVGQVRVTQRSSGVEVEALATPLSGASRARLTWRIGPVSYLPLDAEYRDPIFKELALKVPGQPVETKRESRAFWDQRDITADLVARGFDPIELLLGDESTLPNELSPPPSPVSPYFNLVEGTFFPAWRATTTVVSSFSLSEKGRVPLQYQFRDRPAFAVAEGDAVALASRACRLDSAGAALLSKAMGMGRLLCISRIYVPTHSGRVELFSDQRSEFQFACTDTEDEGKPLVPFVASRFKTGNDIRIMRAASGGSCE